MSDDTSSKILELQKQVSQLAAELAQKQKLIFTLQKTEAALDSQLQSALARAIDAELKAVLKAEKNKSHVQAELSLRLERLKKRKQQLTQKTVIIKKLRSQQEKIKSKIGQLKNFVQKNSPVKQKAPVKKAVLKAKHKAPEKKPLLKRFGPKKLKLKIVKAQKIVSKPALAKPKQLATMKKPLLAKISKPKMSKRPSKPKVQPIPKPVKVEKPKQTVSKPAGIQFAVSPMIEEAKIALAKAVADEKKDWEHIANPVFSMDYPAWESSFKSELSAVVSVEKNGFKLEVIVDDVNEFVSLEESVTDFFNQNPDFAVNEKDQVLEYFFVTYTKTGLVEPVTFYALFAKKQTHLVRIVFSGTAQQHDEFNSVVLKTFKSVQLE